MALTLEEIQAALIEAGLDVTNRSKAIKALQEAEEEKKKDKENNKDGPKAKNKLTVFIRCQPEHEKLFRESAAFVLKSPEEVPDDKLTGLIKESALTQNRNVKKKGKINTWAEWFRFVKGKNRSEQKIVNTTKEPVQVIPLLAEEIDFS